MNLRIPASLRSPLARIKAVFLKEFVQVRRDRLTLGMMVMMPLIQLMIFGYAINMDPKHLPALVIAEDQGRFTRAIVASMENSGYYDFKGALADPAEGERQLKSGAVAFVVTIPANFSRDLLRGDQPQLLIAADASDPSSSSNAIGQAQSIILFALRNELKTMRGESSNMLVEPFKAQPVDIVIHRQYNPEGRSQLSIVPGVIGIILTMTMLMLTSVSMTRESESGTLENLLAMPAQPIEVMIGKLTPYILVGAVQVIISLAAALFLFQVPFIGNPLVLLVGLTGFIISNLSLGFVVSTLARTQMQAIQLSFFILLPSILLSGFAFPFRGMPLWAQWLGEALPITHFLRVIRGVMLKGAGFMDLAGDFFALLVITLALASVAMLRYRRTLD